MLLDSPIVLKIEVKVKASFDSFDVEIDPVGLANNYLNFGILGCSFVGLLGFLNLVVIRKSDLDFDCA